MAKIGDKIRIINLFGEPFNTDYVGKEGIVMGFDKDCYGETRIYGSWGSVFIYPNVDTYEIIG